MIIYYTNAKPRILNDFPLHFLNPHVRYILYVNYLNSQILKIYSESDFPTNIYVTYIHFVNNLKLLFVE